MRASSVELRVQASSVELAIVNKGGGVRVGWYLEIVVLVIFYFIYEVWREAVQHVLERATLQHIATHEIPREKFTWYSWKKNLKLRMASECLCDGAKPSSGNACLHVDMLAWRRARLQPVCGQCCMQCCATASSRRGSRTSISSTSIMPDWCMPPCTHQTCTHQTCTHQTCTSQTCTSQTCHTHLVSFSAQEELGEDGEASAVT